MSDGLAKRRGEIERLIEKVRPYLASDDTFDILVNPPNRAREACEVWVDSADGGLVNTGLVLPAIEVENLNRSIASELGRRIDDEHPILMGELPWDGSRVTALHYPITRTGPALCLRKPSSRLITLDDYEKSGALDRNHRPVIEHAIETGLNGLIAGSPGAGKTTLLNGVLLVARQRDPNRRLFVIEDVEELKAEALPENSLRVQPSIDPLITDSDLVRVGKRVRPDGIIVAELIRPHAAYAFFESLNTGMNSSWSTVHANNAHDAFITCETLIEQVQGIDVSAHAIARAIQIVVFVTRLRGGGRRITEVARVHGARGRGDYQLEYVEPALTQHELERKIA
jgi:Flp pilus assembly CpaF family ATPase